MKRLGRVIVFAAALFAVGTIVSGIMGLGGWEGAGVSLCSLGSPEEVYLDSFMQVYSDEVHQAAGDDDTPVTFVIQPGETAGQVADRLEQVGLVSNGEVFRRYLQVEGLDVGLEAGTFTLRQTMSMAQIAVALQTGQLPEREVTIREGLRVEEVAIEVSLATGIPAEEFLEMATTGWRQTDLISYPFLSSLPPGATLEGFLLPDTYRVLEDATAYDIVARLLATFSERVTLEMQLAAANRGLTVYEMITLASIVEREAVLDAERPIIAGVYYNRLEYGWLLNADPTVQYGLGYDESTGEWWRQLYFDQLGISSLIEIDNPYNTYRYVGLPPSPICSPGLASIEGVAYPVDTDYFYFLADCNANDGSHLFAVTEEEHYANYSACGGGGE